MKRKVRARINATIWIPGTINNATGTITNSVWGSRPAANTGGRYATLTFEAIAQGVAYVNITRAAIAFNMTMVTYNITNNATVSVTSYVPDVPSGFDAQPYSRTQINLVWTKGARADKTYIQAKLGEYPSSRIDGTNVYNGTGTSTTHPGLNPNEHWYYRAWSWNETGGFYSASYVEDGATTYANSGPTIFNENPANGSINIDKWQNNVSVHIADLNGDNMSWSIETSTGGSSSGHETNSTQYCSLATPLTYNQVITWYVNVTDGFDWARATYHFTVRNQYVPGPPTSFDAIKYNVTQIDLTWLTGTNASNTYVEWNTTGVWDIGQGTTLYMGTGTACEHSGLSPGTRYYYQAWSYNGTDGFYSTTYASDDAQTGINNAPLQAHEQPLNNATNVEITTPEVSIVLEDPDGDHFSWSIQGNYVNLSYASGATNGTKTAGLQTPLPYDTTVFWYVNVTDGFNWTNATYNFHTRAQHAPDQPTNFIAYGYQTTQINLTWTKGINNVDTTYIEWNATSSTWSRGDGAVLYNGTGTSTEQTGLGPHTIRYYQAWSYNASDNIYSNPAYANATTSNNAPGQPTDIIPANRTNYTSVYHRHLNVTVSDPDNDTLDVYFYWGDGTPIAFNSGVQSGKTADIDTADYVLRGFLNHQNQTPTYYWYVNITDGFNTTTSAIFQFNTSVKYDLDENHYVNYLDASLFVSEYGKASVPPGLRRSDINEDGNVNYLDASGFVGNYGRSYSV